MASPEQFPIELRHAVIDAYREQLRGRYERENIRRFDEFLEVGEEKVTALRDFFMNHIYPPAAQRDRLDAASDRVKTMLKSPRRLLPMVGLALGSMRRFGASLPAAAATTRKTMEAFELTRALEGDMMAYCHECGITPAQLEDGAVMPEVIAHVPKAVVDEFRKDVIELFGAMANATFLEPAIEIMERGIEVIKSKPKVYDREDLEGFKYGRELLIGCLTLHDQLEPDDVPRILEGIKALELEWYDRVLEQAAANTKKSGRKSSGK
jgi:hypothetical protein